MRIGFNPWHVLMGGDNGGGSSSGGGGSSSYGDWSSLDSDEGEAEAEKNANESYSNSGGWGGGSDNEGSGGFTEAQKQAAKEEGANQETGDGPEGGGVGGTTDQVGFGDNEGSAPELAGPPEPPTLAGPPEPPTLAGPPEPPDLAGPPEPAPPLAVETDPYLDEGEAAAVENYEKNYDPVTGWGNDPIVGVTPEHKQAAIDDKVNEPTVTEAGEKLAPIDGAGLANWEPPKLTDALKTTAAVGPVPALIGYGLDYINHSLKQNGWGTGGFNDDYSGPEGNDSSQSNQARDPLDDTNYSSDNKTYAKTTASSHGTTGTTNVAVDIDDTPAIAPVADPLPLPEETQEEAGQFQITPGVWGVSFWDRYLDRDTGSARYAQTSNYEPNRTRSWGSIYRL